jgi:hypothetical protein
MSDIDSLLIFAGFVFFLLVALAIAGARDPNIRRKVSVFTKSGPIETFWVKRKTLRTKDGKPVVTFRGVDYYYIGPQYPFYYRLVRSFGVRKYLGLQRIYIEGNPSPYVIEEDKRMAVLREAGRLLHQTTESDLPMKLLRPRKVDMVLLLLVGVMAFFIGFGIGGRV